MVSLMAKENTANQTGKIISESGLTGISMGGESGRMLMEMNTKENGVRVS